MSQPRRVLAVDEQRATLEFLQSVLPLVEGEQFEILRALSAEEGLLELRRQPYDLLVAGLRLPGMGGLELCRWAKRLRPTMGVILATGRPLAELSEQVTAAGIDHLLHKPLDAEEFLAAVKAAMPAATAEIAHGSRANAGEEPVALPGAAVRRLEALNDETGAGQIVLATVSGEVVHATGGQVPGDIARLVSSASAGVSRALELSDHLNGGEPKIIQFVQGAATDLYWANVGREYFMVILFDARLRRGRIGTVWVFTQRAVGELKRLLAGRVTPAPASPREARPRTTPVRPAPASDAAGQAASGARPDEETGRQAESADRADAEPTATAPPAAAEKVEVREERSRTSAEQALDAFWDEALAGDDGADAFSAGISLAEAKARGLVAEDFDPEASAGDAD